MKRSRHNGVRSSARAREYSCRQQELELQSQTVVLTVQLRTGYRAEWWQAMATPVFGQDRQELRWLFRVGGTTKVLTGRSPLPITSSLSH